MSNCRFARQNIRPPAAANDTITSTTDHPNCSCAIRNTSGNTIAGISQRRELRQQLHARGTRAHDFRQRLFALRPGRRQYGQ
jgi:hypothetical protein